MEGTCDPKNCKLFDLLGGTPEQCPNFIETWWQPTAISGESIPKKVNDCAPKRSLLMIQELHGRLIGIQQTQEQARNEAVWVQVFAELIGKNLGVDLGKFVEERERLVKIQNIKKAVLIEERNNE